MKIAVLAVATSMCIGDANGDGRMDAIVGGAGNNPGYWVALAQGGGEFEITSHVFSLATTVNYVSAARLTTDQNLDLAFGITRAVQTRRSIQWPVG